MMTLQSDHISALILAEQQQQHQQHQQDDDAKQYNRQQQQIIRARTANNESKYSPSNKSSNFMQSQSTRAQTGIDNFSSYKHPPTIPNRYQHNDKKPIHNKNKTYQFQHEILKSLSDQLYQEEERNAESRYSQNKGMMSATDKYQKTIDFSKLGSNPYRRDGGNKQQQELHRSESTKSKRGNPTSSSGANHNRGQSMINAATISSNNQSYYRPVSSTKNAIGPMISSRAQNNSGLKPQQPLNYMSMNPKKVNTNNGAQISNKKFPQSTKQSTRPRSLKLAFQPAITNSTTKSITISSQQQHGPNATTSSINSTARKANKPSSQPFSPYQSSIGDFRGNQTVARSHAFQNSNSNNNNSMNLNATTGGIIGAIPKTITNSKMPSNGPPSSRSSSHRPPSNRGQHRFHGPQSSRFQTNNNSKSKGIINQTISTATTSNHHHHHHHNSSHYNRTLFDSSIGVNPNSNNSNNQSSKNNHKIRHTFGTSQPQQQHHTRSKTALADSYQDFLQRLSPQTSGKKKPSERQSSQLKSRMAGSSSKVISNNSNNNNNNNTMYNKNNDSGTIFRQSSQSAMAGGNFNNTSNNAASQQRRGNSQMKQRQFSNNDNSGYSGSGITIMPWTLNPSVKINEFRGNTSATLTSSKMVKGNANSTTNKYNNHHHHHHHHHSNYLQQQSHHNRSGTTGFNSSSSQNNGQTAPQKFANLKKQLSKINQNLKQTIRRMNTNNGQSGNNSSNNNNNGNYTRSAVSSSREMNRQSSAERIGGAVVVGQSTRNNQTPKIRISQLLNSQR